MAKTTQNALVIRNVPGEEGYIPAGNYILYSPSVFYNTYDSAKDATDSVASVYITKNEHGNEVIGVANLDNAVTSDISYIKTMKSNKDIGYDLVYRAAENPVEIIGKLTKKDIEDYLKEQKGEVFGMTAKAVIRLNGEVNQSHLQQIAQTKFGLALK